LLRSATRYGIADPERKLARPIAAARQQTVVSSGSQRLNHMCLLGWVRQHHDRRGQRRDAQRSHAAEPNCSGRPQIEHDHVEVLAGNRGQSQSQARDATHLETRRRCPS
jgi:hypothetical protein